MSQHSSSHITTVVSNSLISGSFPESFKSAVVKPLLKRSSLDPENLSNYCSVSSLHFLSKIPEEVVLAQLLEYLQTNKRLYHLQSSYRSGHSTETALLIFSITYCQLWATIIFHSSFSSGFLCSLRHY